MSNETVHVFTWWRVKEGQLETLLNLLMEVVRKSMEEQGNLYYKVHQSKGERNTLLILEGYIDETALAKHRSSEHFQRLVEEEIFSLLDEQEVIMSTQLVMALPGLTLQQCVPVL